MKLFCLFVLAAAAIATSSAQASDAAHKAAPNPDATLTYIHAAWDTLTRSMTDCPTLADSKITATPVLYLPAELPTPPEVAAIKEKCKVKIAALPRRIVELADVRPEQLPAAGLLYLPHPYVVPGGRFNEMYGWDSYFRAYPVVTQDHKM